MMKTLLFSTFIIFIVCSQLSAQEKDAHWRLGINYGYGSQNYFPLPSEDYTYETQFYKAQINYLLREKRAFQLELNIEPSYYIAQHQLVNEYFVSEARGKDYLRQREQFSEKKTLQEYVMNFGILSRLRLYKNLSTYALGSVGPMISDTATERLAKGFAFSDILAVGLTFKYASVYIDSRLSLRHVSNARLQYPNNGHNSASFEVGLGYQL